MSLKIQSSIVMDRQRRFRVAKPATQETEYYPPASASGFLATNKTWDRGK
jgi:hypothetical protein